MAACIALRTIDFRLLFAIYALLVSGANAYRNKFTVCDNSAIVVQDLTIVCDSPGSYYYGSTKYRNAASCQGGDKAKFYVAFQIQKNLTTTGYKPYLTIDAQGYGTVSSVNVYSAAELCSVSGLKASNGQVCPEAGNYYLNGSFYWNEKSDNYTYTFSPKLSVGFMSSPSKSVYDLGGANTQQCAGTTFVDWSKTARSSAMNSIQTFFATFGILLGAIAALTMVGWYLTRQATPKKLILEDPDDADNDYHKVQMLGDKDQNLVLV
jgi:hypothetical protein